MGLDPRSTGVSAVSEISKLKKKEIDSMKSF
jgi:hypothetical protein